MEITKLNAARMQLHTAIELWFSDANPVSIHTLASAAHQIVHDLNRHNKGPDLLLDSAFIKPERRREFVAIVKSASNFMKHADRGPAGRAKTFDFNPDSNQDFIMFTIFGLKYLREHLGPEEIAFEFWQIIRDPDLMEDAGKAAFDDLFTVDTLKIMRAMPKHKFLEKIRLLFRQGKLPRVPHGLN